MNDFDTFKTLDLVKYREIRLMQSDHHPKYLERQDFHRPINNPCPPIRHTYVMEQDAVVLDNNLEISPTRRDCRMLWHMTRTWPNILFGPIGAYDRIPGHSHRMVTHEYDLWTRSPPSQYRFGCDAS